MISFRIEVKEHFLITYEINITVTLKRDKDIARKENSMPIFLMSTDA